MPALPIDLSPDDARTCCAHTPCTLITIALSSHACGWSGKSIYGASREVGRRDSRGSTFVCKASVENCGVEPSAALLSHRCVLSFVRCSEPAPQPLSSPPSPLSRSCRWGSTWPSACRLIPPFASRALSRRVARVEDLEYEARSKARAVACM